MQSAAEAWAHVVHAPAGGNRGDQLVVGAHVGTSKNENPGRCGLPGFSAGRRIAFQSDRKAMSGGESRLDHLGGLEHDVRNCRGSRSWKQLALRLCGLDVTEHRTRRNAAFRDRLLLLRVVGHLPVARDWRAQRTDLRAGVGQPLTRTDNRERQLSVIPSARRCIPGPCRSRMGVVRARWHPAVYGVASSLKSSRARALARQAERAAFTQWAAARTGRTWEKVAAPR